jgi:serine/threonine protein kinase
MSNDSSETVETVDSQEALVAELVDDFLARAGRGDDPDIEQYAKRYPQVANVLRGLLPAMKAMSDSAPPDVSTEGNTTSPEVAGSLGDYRILREIGRGGMGVVYEAEQISLRRRVALKVLPFAVALDPRRLERFKNEALAAAKLHHSNIVPVYAVGCERGVYYFAMQMIEGASLAEAIDQRRQLSEPDSAEVTPSWQSPSECSDVLNEILFARNETAQPAKPAETQARTQAALSTVGTTNGTAFYQTVARLGIQAAEALDHAHGMDVVHRDIKPANLLVDLRGNLWVTDFGLARLQGDGELTMTGDVVGTFRYMSPEQALGNNSAVDHRSDIYSLGATLYQLLTLRPVFDGDNREELLAHITSKDPISPRRIDKSIPTDLETIVLKAIAAERQDRYATASEMADDLRCFLDSRPIRARRPTLAERAAKWSRRHKAMVASALVVLLLAVVALTISNVLIAQERARTHDAYKEVEEKQAVTATALAEEARQRALAEKNFQQAREMLDFFVQASVEDLAGLDEARAVRSKLLEASLNYYDDFIQQSRDNPPLQAELAASHLRVAEILDGIGSATAAKSALEKALETQERLVRENPDQPELRRVLFNMYHEFDILRGVVSLHLVAGETVQQHLELTEQQIAKINEINEEHWRLYQQLCESKSTDLARMRKEFLDHKEGAKAAIAETLNQEQMKRLDQLVLQRRREAAFDDPTIADELGLRAAQREKIASLQNERRFSFRRQGPGRFGGRSGLLDERVEEVLTPAQQDKWKEMTGEPFEGIKGRPFGESLPGPGMRGRFLGRKPPFGPR